MTGRGIRVAIVDSGVHAQHPHVNGVAGGVAIDADGRGHADFVDRLGHGTAVIAAIRDLAPDAELFAVKVFDRRLAAPIGALVHAIEWAAQERMHIVNLSLGSPKREHEAVLRRAVDVAISRGVVVIAARDDNGVDYLPGSLDGVLPVQMDPSCLREEVRVITIDHRRVVRASDLPRSIPGVPPERNLRGVSFAVANTTGIVACAMEAMSERSVSSVLDALEGRGGKGDMANG